MYGELPSSKELARWDEALMRHSAVPDAVERAVAALPHDAHFMGIVLVALNALSTVHPEQKPGAGRAEHLQVQGDAGQADRAPHWWAPHRMPAVAHAVPDSPSSTLAAVRAPAIVRCGIAQSMSRTQSPEICAGKQLLCHAGKMPGHSKPWRTTEPAGRNFKPAQPSACPTPRTSSTMLDAANKPGYKPNPRCELALLLRMQSMSVSPGSAC